MSGRRRRRRAEPTDDWQQLELLSGWPEQVRYELLRPIVLFDVPPAERARETGAASERMLQRRAARFETEGMESLFDAPAVKRRRLPPSLRRLIVDLKAEHPALSLGEVANVCYVRSGRRPSKHTVKRVLEEEPRPLRMVRRFDPYHETEDPRERRLAVVRLHSEGWAPRASWRRSRAPGSSRAPTRSRSPGCSTCRTPNGRGLSGWTGTPSEVPGPAGGPVPLPRRPLAPTAPPPGTGSRRSPLGCPRRGLARSRSCRTTPRRQGRAPRRPPPRGSRSASAACP